MDNMLKYINIFCVFADACATLAAFASLLLDSTTVDWQHKAAEGRLHYGCWKGSKYSKSIIKYP